MSTPQFYILNDQKQPIPATEGAYWRWRDEQDKLPEKGWIYHPLGISTGWGSSVYVRSGFIGSGERPGIFVSTLHNADHVDLYPSSLYTMYPALRRKLYAETYAGMVENHLTLYRNAISWCPVITMVQDGDIQILPGRHQSDVFIRGKHGFRDQVAHSVGKDVVLWMTDENHRRLSSGVYVESDWTDEQIRDIIGHGNTMTCFSYQWDYLNKTDLKEREPDTPWAVLTPGWYCWDTAGDDTTVGVYDTEMKCLRYLNEEWNVDEAVFEREVASIHGIWPWAAENYDQLCKTWTQEGVI